MLAYNVFSDRCKRALKRLHTVSLYLSYHVLWKCFGTVFWCNTKPEQSQCSFNKCALPLKSQWVRSQDGRTQTKPGPFPYTCWDERTQPPCMQESSSVEMEPISSIFSCCLSITWLWGTLHESPVLESPSCSCSFPPPPSSPPLSVCEGPPGQLTFDHCVILSWLSIENGYSITVK